MNKHRAICRFITLGVLTALLWLLPVTSVIEAHALLVRATPIAGAELTTAPPTIEMWFSEPLESQFSNAHLMDAQGNAIGGGTSSVDPSDPMHMTLMVTDLPPGIYTVVWRTLSSADGHEWLGSFPITILNADGTRPTVTAASAATPPEESGRGELPTPLQTFSRWLALLGAMIVLGVILVQAFTLQSPSAQLAQAAVALTDPPAKFIAVLRRCVQLSLFVGLGAVLVGGTIQLLWQAQSLGGLAMVPRLLLHTRTGNLLLVRQGLTLLLLLITIVVASRAKHKALSTPLGAVQWLLLPLSLAMLSTFSIVSHAAAVAGSGWAIVGDLIHLVAAAAWVGGLGLLALLLWQLRELPSAPDATALRQTVRRFSSVATLAVFVLICTGLFSSLVQIESIALLWQTTYGLVLLAKLLLVGLALGLALLNHRWIHRKPTVSWTPSTYRTFLRQVWGESLMALVLMLVVAVLVQTKVPQRATDTTVGADNIFNAILSAQEDAMSADHQHADAAATPAHTAEHTMAAMPELTVHLQIAPNQVGNNRYIVHLYQADGSAVGEVQLVRLIFEHQTAELGQATLDLAPQGPTDFFAGEGAYQNRAGPWTVSAYVRRRGMDDLLVKTTVDVPAPGTDVAIVRKVWQNPITTLPGGVVGGGALAALVLLPLVWIWSRR